MSQIGALSVKIGADTAELESGLNNAKKSIGDFDKGAQEFNKTLKQLALVGAAAAAAVGVMVRQAINAADEMGKAAQRIGVTTQELSKLQYAAKLAGVSSGELQSAMARLTKGMSDAQQGTGEAQKGFQALGIQVSNSDGSLKSSSQIMGDVADRFANMRDGAEKTALAISIFGRAGANMIPLLNGGRKAIEEAGDELERMGGVVTPEAAKQAEIFNDNLTRMSEAAKGAANQLATALLPTLNKILTTILAINEVKAEKGFWRTLLGLTELGKIITGHEIERSIVEKMRSIVKAQNEAIEASGRPDTRAAAPLMLGDPSKLKDNMDEHVKLYFDFMERQQQIDEQRKERLAQNVEAFRFAMLSEEEALGETYAKRIEMLQEHFGVDFEMSAQYHELRLAAEQDFMNRMGDIRKRGMTDIERFTQMSYANQVKTITGMMQQMTAGVAGQSREMFNINKAASLANAVIKGYESIQNAYAFGSKFAGPAGGAAMAAIAAAATAVQIRGIASQRFNSGGSVTAPSVAASTPAGAIPVSAVGGGGGGSSSGQTVTIQLQGEVFGREQVRNLITQINEAVSDGSVLRLQ
jgi:hypothetical protein